LPFGNFMNIVERIENTLGFKPVDRLPMIEWADWWDKTQERWRAEGLNCNSKDAAEIREDLGLDSYRVCWVTPRKESCRKPIMEGEGLIKTIDDYLQLKEHLFPQECLDPAAFARWLPRHRMGDTAIWFWIEGFFWFPRTLLGIERHLCAFYDQPELMHLINTDVLKYNLKTIEQICQLCRPSFVLIAEDLSYNHGPMLSRSCFDEYLAPYYCRLVPVMKERGIAPFVDSDGDITQCIDWFKAVGIEGIGPLERMAGVDVAQIRRDHPRLRLIGGFDKTVIHRGESAMHHEFERLLPVMKQGGYLVCVDHQTPPEVSLDQYRRYVILLKEYCRKAAQ
jgi:hypothetical protein